MALKQISDEKMRQTLQRAQEIAQQPIPADQEEELFIQAAEEIGIAREATLQALGERRMIEAAPLSAGDLVFAPSTDGFLYVATIVSVSGAVLRVRFISGGERMFDRSEVQSAALLPGTKVQYKYFQQCWYGGRAERYDPDIRTVFVASSWEMQTRELPLSQVRIRRTKTPHALQVDQMMWRVAATIGAGGTLLGFLLGHFLH